MLAHQKHGGPYRGRFAPSPSGPLHLGSLFCALASYLDARSNRGEWLVRIEDIDPPRQQAGADKQILETLASHGLKWDETPRYQGQQANNYLATLDRIKNKGLSYPCQCTRARRA